MLCSSLHLLCAVCDNLTRGCFERGGLDCVWAEGLLRSLVHCSNVAAVSRRLDTLAKVLPVVVGALSSNPLDFTSGTSEGSQSIQPCVFNMYIENNTRVRREVISLLVLNSISHEFAALTRKISS